MKGKSFFIFTFILTIFSFLTSCSSTKSPNPHFKQGKPTDYALWRGKEDEIWRKLQHTSSKNLREMSIKTDDPVKRGWIDLAVISKEQLKNKALVGKIWAWNAMNPNHPALKLLPKTDDLKKLTNDKTPENIALLLPERGPLAASGKAVRDGFLEAYYKNLNNTKPQRIAFYDTTRDDIKSLYSKAIVKGAQFIIGPLSKENVKTLLEQNEFKVPTIALNYTDISYSNKLIGHKLANKRNLYQFGLLPEDEIAELAYNAHLIGHQKAIVIAPNNEWGKRMFNYFKKVWRREDGEITEALLFNSKSNLKNDIAQLLRIRTVKKSVSSSNLKEKVESEERRQDFDAIFLFSTIKHARIIVPLFKFYYAGNIPIFSTSAIYTDKLNPAKDVDLDGIIVCDIPLKQNSHLQPSTRRLNAVGEDAYQLTQSLSRLKILPNLPIYGKTGALLLNAQEIHRRLPCRPLKNSQL